MSTVITDANLSGNDFSVFICPQTTKGAIDATPVWQPVRRTGGKTMTSVEYTESGEIKSNRQGRSQIQDNQKYGLPIEGELNKQAIGLMISAMHADETALSDTDTVYAATSTGFTSTGGELGALGLSVGDYFWISGFVDSDIDVMYRVTAQADADTVTTYPSPAATEAAGESVTITSNKSINGKSATLYATQTRAPDLTKAGDIDYDTQYDGVQENFNISIPESGISTYSTEIKSEKAVAGTAIISGQTDAAKGTDESVSAVQNIKEFFIDGIADSAATMKNIDIEIANNYQEDLAARTLGARMSYGDVGVTGSTSVRSPKSNPFVWRDKNRNGTRVEIGVLIEHSDGHQTMIVMRKCVVTENEMDDGSNAVANSSCSFQAEENPTTSSTIELFRNWQ